MKLLRTVFLIPFFFVLGCAGNIMSEDLSVQQSGSERFIVKSASVALKTGDVSQAAADIISLVVELEGIVQSNNQNSNGRINLHVKIPADILESFVSGLSAYGDVIRKSISSEDVTEQMIDVNAKLSNLLLLKAKYLEILKGTSSVSDTIEIQKELTKIQIEIDSIEGRRKSLVKRVNLSSVQISLEKKKIYGPLGYLGIGISWFIGKLFVIN